ncbi:peptidylprolyl isomerase [Colwellia sp. MEBiC06753]
MEIINAAPIAEHQHHHACDGHHGEIDNPAINHGDFSEVEDELQAAKRVNDIPSEVPEITVNGKLITEQSVLAEMQYHPASSKRQSMVKAAEYLIIGELIKQKAQELNVPFNEIALDTQSEYELINQLIELEYASPVASTAECERFYQQNKQKFTTSPLLEVRHILLAAAPDDTNERMRLKDVADDMIQTLTNSPTSFNELVASHSACPSKAMNGNLGQISQGQTVPEFERQLFKAEQGLIQYPIESRYGFHIVIIDRKVAGVPLPFEYVKDKVMTYLNDKVQRKNIAQYIQQLIQDADISGFNFDYDGSPLVQ